MYPSGNVTFYRDVNIRDYSDQIYFDSYQDQLNFFNSRDNYVFTEFQFVQANYSIRLELNYYDCLGFNYASFINADFNLIPHYCFVRNIEYINDSVTNISLEVDVWQTFMFNVNFFKTSFIERALPISDNFVDSSLPLRSGDIDGGGVYQSYSNTTRFFTDFYILISSSCGLYDPFGTIDNPTMRSSHGRIVDKVPSCLAYYIVPIDTFYSLMSYLSSYPWILQTFQALTVIPSELVGNLNDLSSANINNGTSNVRVYQLTDGWISKQPLPFNFGSLLDDYTNYLNGIFGTNYINKKLYGSTYTHIEILDHNGNAQIINFEDLRGGGINEIGLNLNTHFHMINFVGASPSLMGFIENYNNDPNYNLVTDVDSYMSDLGTGIVVSNYPQFPVAIDNYLLYMAQNANQIKTDYNYIKQSNQLNRQFIRENSEREILSKGVGGILGGVGDFFSGNFGGGIKSVSNSLFGMVDTKEKAEQSRVKSNVDEKYSMDKMLSSQADKKVLPDTIQGMANGYGFNIANGFFGFVFNLKVLRAEYLKRINQYFNQFGYAYGDYADITTLFKARKVCNYIKVIGACAKPSSQVPDYATQIINSMFNNGVRLWRNNNPYFTDFSDNPPS